MQKLINILTNYGNVIKMTAFITKTLINLLYIIRLVLYRLSAVQKKKKNFFCHVFM